MGEGAPDRAVGEELEARADRLVDTSPDGSSEDGEEKGELEAPSTTADRMDEGEAGGVPSLAPGTYGGSPGGATLPHPQMPHRQPQWLASAARRKTPKRHDTHTHTPGASPRQPAQRTRWQ